MRVADAAASMGADSLVNILNGHSVALELARSDRASIKNETGNIQASQRHYAPGNGLVAADQDDQRIEEVAASHQFYRIGDDLAADERRAHAFRAHGDAVGNRYGVEFERSAAGGANACLHVLREFAQVIVARAYLDPRVGHADQRFLEVFILETRSAEHGARPGAMCSVGQCMAARLGLRIIHVRIPSVVIDFLTLEISPRKPGAIILIWMVAPKPSGDAELGRHHPLMVPRTTTGLIRTTT